MKVTFTKLDFASLIKRVSSAISSNSTNEILRHVMIQAAPGSGVALVGSDSEISTIARSVVPVVQEEGITLLPLKPLSTIADLADDMITMTCDAKEATITSGETAWRFSVMDPALYPQVPRVSAQAIPIPRQRLIDAITLVRAAIGADESRPSLLMLALDSQGVYATDGARVHFAALPTEFEQLHIPSSAVKPLLELLKYAADDYVYVEETEANVVFQIGQDEFSSRTLDAEFPPVRQSLIAPRQSTHQVEAQLPRLRFIMNLKRSAIATDDSSGVVTLQLGQDGRCIMTSQSLKGDRTVSIVPITYAGQPRSVAFSIEALLDAMAGVSEEMVSLRFSPQVNDGSVLVISRDFLAVVLPRIRQA